MFKKYVRTRLSPIGRAVHILKEAFCYSNGKNSETSQAAQLIMITAGQCQESM